MIFLSHQNQKIHKFIHKFKHKFIHKKIVNSIEKNINGFQIVNLIIVEIELKS